MKRLFWFCIFTSTFYLPSLLASESGDMGDDKSVYKSVAYLLGVAGAAMFGTMSQSRAASTAIDGIARNPEATAKIQTAMILSLAFIESLVIFTLLSIFLV